MAQPLTPNKPDLNGQKPAFTFGTTASTGGLVGNKGFSFASPAQPSPAPSFTFGSGQGFSSTPSATPSKKAFAFAPTQIAKPALDKSLRIEEFVKNLAGINASLQKFVQQTVSADRIVDLTPCLASYESHRKSIMDKYKDVISELEKPKSVEKPIEKALEKTFEKAVEKTAEKLETPTLGFRATENTTPKPDGDAFKPKEVLKPETPKASFSFGASEKPVFSFGADSTKESKPADAKFGFKPVDSKPVSKPEIPFGFGSEAPKPAPTFTFGASSEKPAEKSTPAFGSTFEKPAFGSTSEKSSFGSTPAKPTFGSAADKPTFGSTTEKSSSTPTFSFGSAAEKQTFGSASDKPAAAPTFSFGSSDKPDKPAAPAFSFGSSDKPATDKPAAPAFSFGSTSEKPATPTFSFGAPTVEKPVASSLGSKEDKPFSFSASSASPFAFNPNASTFTGSGTPAIGEEEEEGDEEVQEEAQDPSKYLRGEGEGMCILISLIL
jgi:hypothetical protein